jgi:hypothetical protein
MFRILLMLAALTGICFPAPSRLAGVTPEHDLAAPSPIFGSREKKRSRAQHEEADFRIAGEVTRGNAFQQDIGRGLVFQLAPPSNAPDAGWVIEIVPKTKPASGAIEFSSVATPPYHTYNDRIIVPAYGRSTSDVLHLKNRTFFFVDSVNDEHRAEEVVNAAYYPTDLSDQDRVRVAAEEHQIQISQGELHILKAHTSHSKIPGAPDSIDSIRFELDIEFSPGLTMADILARVIRPQ